MSKWIVVTGASKGIGKEVAYLLLNNGYQLVLTARSEDSLQKVYSSYEKNRYEIIPWDLSDLDNLGQYVKEVNKRVGAIVGLVHCAGVQHTTPLHIDNKNKMLSTFNINTFAAIGLVGGFSKNNYYNKYQTSFVLISSLATRQGAHGKSIYAASKGALEGFLIPAASELVYKGIRLNVITPGMVNTNMNEAFYKHLTEQQIDEIKSSYPLGLGEGGDVANIVAFLISEKSRWITGQSIIVDGGFLARKI